MLFVCSSAVEPCRQEMVWSRQRICKEYIVRASYKCSHVKDTTHYFGKWAHYAKGIFFVWMLYHLTGRMLFDVYHTILLGCFYYGVPHLLDHDWGILQTLLIWRRDFAIFNFQNGKSKIMYQLIIYIWILACNVLTNGMTLHTLRILWNELGGGYWRIIHQKGGGFVI